MMLPGGIITWQAYRHSPLKPITLEKMDQETGLYMHPIVPYDQCYSSHACLALYAFH